MASKNQLVAIYTLQFYKNKKKWKIADKSTTEPRSNIKLNETYNLEKYDDEPAYDVEQVSPHNKAFLQEEPDDGLDRQPRDAGPPALPVADHRQYYQHSWVEQPYSGDDTQPYEQDVQQEWCGEEAEGMPEELYSDQCDGPYRQDVWPSASQYEFLKPESDPLEYLSPSEMLHLAEEWLHRHGCPVLQEEFAPYYEQYALLDDSADFMRGAHYAPHSSEVELSVSHDEWCAEAGARVAGLSRARLRRRLRAHCAALARLLREDALRDTLYSHSTLQPPIPFEEYPTRDTDPLGPQDCVLSGSHLLPNTGRGRGRLHQADRIIGIGMGRPYRL